MALTYSQYVGDGSTRAFAVTFPYISKNHVKVRVDGTIVPFTWASSTLIQINPAPNAGSVIDVRRETPNTEALVDFHDGSTLVESDLDLSTLQTLYIAQELVDTLNQKLGVDTDGTINAGTRRIKNVGAPRDVTDAVNKAYVDDITGNAPAYAEQAKTYSETASAQAGIASAQAGIAATKAGEASSSATAAAASAAQAIENSRKTVTPFIWTAMAGQTDFPFGQTIDPALVLVFVNGAKFPLGMGDYAINSTQITLAAPAAAGDLVEAYVFAPFAVPNALTPANNLAELADKAAARANLGLGTTAQNNTGTGPNMIPYIDSNGKFAAIASLPSGSVIGRAYREIAGLSGPITTVIPFDNTVPQITEGTEIFSLQYTPKVAGSRLRVRFKGLVSQVNSDKWVIVSAFFNGAPNAIDVGVCAFVSGTTSQFMGMETEVTPSGLTPQTVSIRIGPSSSGTAYYGGPSTANFGNSIKTVLTIEEIAP